jgi:asparagine synthase (glutamine-hydrolysing)
MCGFTGILYGKLSGLTRDKRLAESVISGMTKPLFARGPDAGAHWVGHDIALGHRRLSILDLTDNGAQPMELRPGGPVIAYNGEAYNFSELRRELASAGRVFRGHSDTEVILQSYDAWGLDGLKRLEGIFAFGLWDPARQRLILMRDRLGVKPLYYGKSTHGLAFGSEIKAVLAAGGVDTSLDDQSFSEYLWYGNPFEDRTFYKGVRALEPGHWLVIEGDKRRLEPWWRIEEWLGRPVAAHNMSDAASLVRKALDQAVERQLVADVPVGIFLSGGVDSSAIAASAMQSRRQPLRSYAAGFDFNAGVNELPKASRVAQHLGLDHHELRVTGGDLPEVLLTLAQAHDEPFADAANIPLYLMCRQLAGQIKVVLQGDGGDELFAGYRRYSVLRNAHWWRLWPQVLSPLARAGGNMGRRFARMADSVGNCDPAMRMAYLLTVETPQDPPEALFLPERRRQLAETTDPFLVYRRAAERFHKHDPVQQMLLTDLTAQLPSQFLTKVDRATMAAGIEARVPLLDERVAELVVNMPSNWKAHGTQKKVVLRESQRGRLPTDILDGPKTGFGVPYAHWLRTSLYEFSRERLLDQGFLKQFALDGLKLEQTLAQHRAGQLDRGFILWKLLQISLFWDLRSKAQRMPPQ